MSLAIRGGASTLPIDHGDAATELALLIMKDAEAQHHDHDVEVRSAKQQYIERGAAQVSGMRAAAEHERSAAYAGAAFTAASGALEIAAAAAPVLSSSGAGSPLEGLAGGGESMPEAELASEPGAELSVDESGVEELGAVEPPPETVPSPPSVDEPVATHAVDAATNESSVWSRAGAAAPKALADVSGRIAPFVATLAGGAAGQEDRADATAADHASQVAKMDYDQAREHASRDRDASRSALEGLRTATSSQHEARMAIFRG